MLKVNLQNTKGYPNAKYLVVVKKNLLVVDHQKKKNAKLPYKKNIILQIKNLQYKLI